MTTGGDFLKVNVLSGVRLSRAYLAGMKQRHWGRIVFISSESALQIPAEMIHYGMTKTAQIAVARGLAELCAAYPCHREFRAPWPHALRRCGRVCKTIERRPAVRRI